MKIIDVDNEVESDDDDGYGIDNEDFVNERGDILNSIDIILPVDIEHDAAKIHLFHNDQLESVIELCFQYCRHPGDKGRMGNGAFSYKKFKSGQLNYA